MKITLMNCVNTFNSLSQLQQMNPRLSPKLTGNRAYLLPEVQKWFELTAAERESFGQAEIDLPLQPITEDDLPPAMPPALLQALNPIAAEPFEQPETELEKLMKAQSAEY
jgi:hypothetical protein